MGEKGFRTKFYVVCRNGRSFYSVIYNWFISVRVLQPAAVQSSADGRDGTACSIGRQGWQAGM